MHPAPATANKPPLSRKHYLIAPILLNCFGLELLVRLTNEVGNGEVDHFIAAAVEHRFESPKIKADRLVEFDCRGHGQFGLLPGPTSAGPFQEFVFQPIGFA